MPELDIHWKRRTFLAACVAAPIGLLAAKKPRDQGQGGHDDYFAGLQQALRDADLMRPTLVIDRARLDANIALLKQHLPSDCLLYTSPSPRDLSTSRMPSSA